MNNIYSHKQKELLKLWQEGKLCRINILEGSVRSGKTWISLVLWAFWVATMPKESSYLMVAKTLTSLKRNILDPLSELVGAGNFTYSVSKKEGTLLGRKVYFEGVSDSRAESKIRGMTLQGAYCDEITLLTEDFFAMLLSRLSLENAKLIGTTNPDSPNHWLKKKYIDRKDQLDMLVMKFVLDDNIFLSNDYKKSLKKEYTGVFHDRFIRGLWKAADGCIYPEFANHRQDFIIDSVNPDGIAFATVGVDFGGNKSAHAFVCTGFTRGMKEVVTLDEFYMRDKISPTQLEAYFIEFIRRNRQKYSIYEVYCDSAETTLIQGIEMAAFRAELGVDINLAVKGRINDRIQFYNSLMAQGRYRVLSHCTHVIEAFESAVWDGKSLSDRRLDDGSLNIDSLDAQEYSTEKYMRDIINSI